MELKSVLCSESLFHIDSTWYGNCFYRFVNIASVSGQLSEN